MTRNFHLAPELPFDFLGKGEGALFTSLTTALNSNDAWTMYLTTRKPPFLFEMVFLGSSTYMLPNSDAARPKIYLVMLAGVVA